MSALFQRLRRHKWPSACAKITTACWIITSLLALHTAMLAWSGHVHSPTLNEPAHLVAGIHNWQTGRFDVYKANPPLVRMVAAIPALMAGAQTDWHNYVEGAGSRPEFALGEDFVAANAKRPFWYFTLARWACIPFSLAGGYFCFRWARELYGVGAGLLAISLWCFCPNILAYGPLITPDAAAAALGLIACYAFWRWLKRPTWYRALIAGLILGVAELTKMTLIVFFPLWFVMWLVYRWSDRKSLARRDWLRQFVMLGGSTCIALYILSLGYGFEGTFTRLSDFAFVSSTLANSNNQKESPLTPGNRFANTWLGSLPVPLPKNYVLGIDLQKLDFEKYHEPSYLRGQFSDKGWWYYYLYALAIKVPLGTWLLIGMASVQGLWLRSAARHFRSSASEDRGNQQGFATCRDQFVLLCPPIAILAFVSSQSGFSEHLRYVLPAFPFMFVWVGRVTCFLGRTHLIATSLATAALTWSIASSAFTYPHCLSYFNELVGGPIGGPAHLIHSNVDWGQDLFYFQQWLGEHPEANPIKLAYFGYFDPTSAGIEYIRPDIQAIASGARRADSKIPPGWYAIGVNLVRGLPWSIYDAQGGKTYSPQNALSYFQRLKPVAMAGYSIYIYHITLDEAERGRPEIGSN